MPLLALHFSFSHHNWRKQIFVVVDVKLRTLLILLLSLLLLLLLCLFVCYIFVVFSFSPDHFTKLYK